MIVGVPRRSYRGGPAEAPDVDNGWREAMDKWRDVITAPLVLVVLGMGLAFRGFAIMADQPNTAALLTGIAAVVSAGAAVIEARRGKDQAALIADHEARLRVLEDRGGRS